MGPCDEATMATARKYGKSAAGLINAMRARYEHKPVDVVVVHHTPTDPTKQAHSVALHVKTIWHNG